MKKGEVIHDFVLETKIGSGGLGEVWLARHRRLDEVVAIRVVDGYRPNDPKFEERFLHYARAMVALKHPHIVHFYDLFSDDEKLYLVMSYIDGGSLEDWLKHCGSLEEHAAVQISRQVLDALDYAHQNGVIHRDVKPSNILLDDNGNAYLVDFGIAKLLGKSRVTTMGANIATPEYMSPEQISAGTIDHRTNVYSFGCVLYEMLTGRSPFHIEEEGVSDFDIMSRHVHEMARPVRQAVPTVSEQTEKVVMRALAKQPQDRFQSCSDMKAALPSHEELSLTPFSRRPSTQNVPAPSDRVARKWAWEGNGSFTGGYEPSPPSPRIMTGLPDTLRWQLAARAFLDTTDEVSAYAPEPSYYPGEVSARPLSTPISRWVRYILLAGGIATALWLGAKLLPFVLGTTTRVNSRRTEESSAETTSVDCSVFAPLKVTVRDEILVQVYLHPPGTAADAKAGAKQFDADAEWRGFTSLSLDLAAGTRVGVQLDVGDLVVSDDGIGEVRWNNTVAGLSFRVSAPKDTKPGKHHATASFSVQGIPAGRIHFVIEVTEFIETDVPPRGIGDSAHRYKKAFISYASEDRAEVLKRVQTLHALKIDFFQDVLDLEPGDRWEQALYMEINHCDLFLLFWSSASRASKWVHREASYALDRQKQTETGEPAIIPLLLEGPPPPKPWPEFAHLHFNDKLVYLMRVETAGGANN